MPGYDDLNEREKDLCVVLTLQPQVYLALKERILKKAASSKKPLRRAIVVDLIDEDMTKDKGFVVFDFLALQKLIPTKGK